MALNIQITAISVFKGIVCRINVSDNEFQYGRNHCFYILSCAAQRIKDRLLSWTIFRSSACSGTPGERLLNKLIAFS